jgi:hypothetical protein
MRGKTMLVRFANVIYWACSAVAALIVTGAWYAYSQSAPIAREPGAAIIISVVGGLVWLFGRAVRYILAG